MRIAHASLFSVMVVYRPDLKACSDCGLQRPRNLACAKSITHLTASKELSTQYSAWRCGRWRDEDIGGDDLNKGKILDKEKCRIVLGMNSWASKISSGLVFKTNDYQEDHAPIIYTTSMKHVHYTRILFVVN